MPSTPQAIARFPGVVSVIGGTFTWGHGETPGVCQLTIAPQPNPPALIGTLTIQYDNVYMEFRDCRIVDASYRRDSSGRIVSLTIEDWRWQWRDRGTISGRYNVRKTDGKIVTHTDKSPQALAKLLFEAMGQTDYDVSLLPDEPRPGIEWDVSNPAQALSALCELLGCRIAPAFDNKAVIVKLGEGNELPDGLAFGRTDLNEVLDPPEKPDALMLLGAPAEFQADLELEAVALEASGKYVLLDDASYKPAGGWTLDDQDDFYAITDRKTRALAQASVYRAYRVKIPSGGLALPGYTDSTGKNIERIDQLEFLGRQCVQVDQLGEKVFLPAIVYGAFEGTANFGDDAYANTIDEPEPITDLESDLAKECTVQGGFSIDGGKGIVTLSQPRILIDNSTYLPSPAKLRLRIAVNVRDSETGGLLRYSRERRYTADSTKKAAIIRHDEIVARSIPTYTAGSASFAVASVEYNVEESDKEADYYLDIEEKQWRDLTPSEATYARIIAVEPDGAIQHVVWSFGNSTRATTRLGRNTEIRNYITPYKQRRQNGKLKELLKIVDQAGW